MPHPARTALAHLGGMVVADGAKRIDKAELRSASGVFAFALAVAMAGCPVGEMLAQTPALAWQRPIPAIGNVDALPSAGDPVFAKRSAVIDALGNTYVTGISNNGANADFLTVKYSPTGAIVWRAVTNGAANRDDLAYAVAVDGSGNVFVTGTTQTANNWNYLTVKYDANGNELWRSTYNGNSNGDDAAHDIVVAPNGDVLVTGISFVSTAYNNYNYITLRLKGSDGTLVWQASLDGAGNGYDHASAIALDPMGLPVVIGYSSNGANPDYVTVKYDAGGAELWRVPLNGAANGTDLALDVAVDALGNVLVTGASSGGAYRDAVTVKYDSAGNELWRQIFNGTNGRHDAGYAVAVDPAGNVYVTGTTGQDFALPQSVSNPAYFLVKYGANGDELWRRVMNGSGTGNEIASGLAVDTAGNAYVSAFASNGTDNVVATFKFDSAGNEAWRALIPDSGSANGAFLPAVRVGVSGDIVVVGFRNNGSDNDFLVAKYDAAGVLQWRANEGMAQGIATTLAAGVLSPGAMASDASGNVFLAGRSGEGSRANFAVGKVTAAGTLSWTRDVNGGASQLDQAYAVALDANGNVFVSGDTYDGGTSDFLTVKLDATGAELWRSIGNAPGSTQDIVKGMVVDSAGDVLVTGATMGASNFDFLTIKLSGTNGSEIWRQTYNGFGNGADVPVAIAVDAARNVYVAGKSRATLFDDMKIFKYAPSGAVVWEASVSNNTQGNRVLNAMAINAAGLVGVGGDIVVRFGADGIEAWRSTGGFTTHALSFDGAGNLFAAGTGGLIVKYSAAGVELWRVAVNGMENANDLVSSIATDALGDVYAVSRSSADVQAAYTVIKLDSYGNVQWRMNLATGGGGAAVRPVLKVMPDGSILIAGNSSSADPALAMTAWKIAQVVPAPTITAAIAGDGVGTFYFEPPADSGAGPVISYSLSCNGGSVGATNIAGSPFTLGGLTNGAAYSCSLVAITAADASEASSPVQFTPSASPIPALVGAAVRRAHGPAGNLDIGFGIAKLVTGNVHTESRIVGATVHFALDFNVAVASSGTVVVKDETGSPAGSATVTFNSMQATVAVDLTPSSDVRRVEVTLPNLNGSGADAKFAIGFLPGDVTNSRSVTAADIAAIKARLSQPVNASNARFDVNGDGVIGSADVSQAKARAGRGLP